MVLRVAPELGNQGCNLQAHEGILHRRDALWAAALNAERAGAVRDALMGDGLFSGWGIRTLSAAHSAFNPMSYHNGSVWPHDNAIIATGLLRYGYVAEAQRIARTGPSNDAKKPSPVVFSSRPR